MEHRSFVIVARKEGNREITHTVVSNADGISIEAPLDQFLLELSKEMSLDQFLLDLSQKVGFTLTAKKRNERMLAGVDIDQLGKIMLAASEVVIRDMKGSTKY